MQQDNKWRDKRQWMLFTMCSLLMWQCGNREPQRGVADSLTAQIDGKAKDYSDTIIKINSYVQLSRNGDKEYMIILKSLVDENSKYLGLIDFDKIQKKNEFDSLIIGLSWLFDFDSLSGRTILNQYKMCSSMFALNKRITVSQEAIFLTNLLLLDSADRKRIGTPVLYDKNGYNYIPSEADRKQARTLVKTYLTNLRIPKEMLRFRWACSTL